MTSSATFKLSTDLYLVSVFENLVIIGKTAFFGIINAELFHVDCSLKNTKHNS